MYVLLKVVQKSNFVNKKTLLNKKKRLKIAINQIMNLFPLKINQINYS